MSLNFFSVIRLATMLFMLVPSISSCMDSAPVYASNGARHVKRGGSSEELEPGEHRPVKPVLAEEPVAPAPPQRAPSDQGSSDKPTQQEPMQQEPETEPRSPKLVGWINLNEASAEQLMLLPRVGPALSARIIAYRERRKFTRPSQLRRVKGIGARTYTTVSMHLRVHGETTLRRSE